MRHKKIREDMHRVWESCMHLPNYRKSLWGFLDNMMNSAVGSPSSNDAEFVLLLAKLYSQHLKTHQDTTKDRN